MATHPSLPTKWERGWAQWMGDHGNGKRHRTMQLKPCPGCGRMVLIHSIANLTVKCEPTPLDGQGVAQELGAGRQIWTPEFGPGLIPKRLRPAQPGDSKLLREHRCAAVSRPGTPSAVPAPPKAAPRPAQRRVAPSTPSSAPRTAPSGAPVAVSHRSETRSHPCDGCGKPVELDGAVDYMALELGATVMWAIHDGCGRKY